MKRYSFRLENILKIRKQVEERIELRFAMKNAEFLKVAKELNKTKEMLRGFIKRNSGIDGTFTAADIIAIDSYIVRLEKTIETLGVQYDKKKNELEEIRLVLNEARKARKLLENLKERSYQKYIDEVNKEEADESDDINQKLFMNKEKLTIEDLPVEEM